MGTQVATIQSIQDTVKERIQASFVDLIPPEMWEGMVKQQIDDFTKSVLPRLVKEEAEKRLRAILAAEFAKPEWAAQWDSHGQLPSQAVVEVIKQAAPDLVAQLFGRMVQNIVMDIRNNPHRF